MSEPLTFKRLCDAAVSTGEMHRGTADYFQGLYLNSDEHRELKSLRGVARRLRALRSDLGRIDLTDSSKRDEVYSLVRTAEGIGPT